MYFISNELIKYIVYEIIKNIFTLSFMSASLTHLCYQTHRLHKIQITVTQLMRWFKGAYWISSNCDFYQYCDSNIGLFSIDPPLVIALPTLR